MDQEEPHTLSVARHAGERGKVLGVLIVSLLYDTVFLGVWVLLNWGLDAWVIDPLRLKGVDYKILAALQYVFGISTLSAVVMFVIEDLITIGLQAYARLKSKLKGESK